MRVPASIVVRMNSASNMMAKWYQYFSSQSPCTPLIVGGVLACLYFLALSVGSTGRCCLWPGTYFELVYGIMAIVRGMQLQQDRAFEHPPNGVCIMGIITIINGDIVNLTMGIIGLCLLGSKNVQRYFRG